MTRSLLSLNYSREGVIELDDRCESRWIYLAISVLASIFLQQREGHFVTHLVILDYDQTNLSRHPASNLRSTPAGGPSTLGLTCTRPTYTSDLWWNRVSYPQPSGLEDETLPSGHHG
ncbi:hypothetical protein AVEN_66715-1 [Araneus ventricosus]|uniref:Uncharacterized protein n=1 Tax=Araneus ventricosus TaxID=182803 RepID=A0A4Y2QB74_ARAVE|nr:hypothetical protein AVEN_66715-1 [Araneus ventricosus]